MLQERFDDWNNIVYFVDDKTGMGVAVEDGVDYDVEYDNNGDILNVSVDGNWLPNFDADLDWVLNMIKAYIDDYKYHKKNWKSKHNKEVKQAEREYKNGNYPYLNLKSLKEYDWDVYRRNSGDDSCYIIFLSDGSTISDNEIEEKNITDNIFKRAVAAFFMESYGEANAAYNDKGVGYMSNFLELPLI